MKNSIIKIKTRNQSYNVFVGNNLFRTDISFDPGVLTGKYEINVLEFKDGKIADSKLLDLEVSKSGIEAYIFDFAHGNPLAYGFIAVLIAFFAGIFADFVFRRILFIYEKGY